MLALVQTVYMATYLDGTNLCPYVTHRLNSVSGLIPMEREHATVQSSKFPVLLFLEQAVLVCTCVTGHFSKPVLFSM